MTALPIVLIIGASRGLGLALAREWLSRGWTVIATARSAGQAAGLQETAATSDGRLTIEQLEMTDVAAVKALRERLSGRELDLVFVNAGVANGPGDRVDQVSTEEFSRIMVTNALSPMRIIEELGDLVRPGGTIAIMSSSMGSVALNETGGWEVYRASKAALNTLMRSYAVRHARDGRSLALVDPGWVRTDMGGSDASISVEESIPGVADALAARRGQPGLRYFNYKGARPCLGRNEAPWTARQFLKQAGISRFGEAEEMADVMAFVVSPAARWMTSTVLRMDGGEVKSV